VLGNGIRFQDFNPTAGNVLQNGSASGDWQLFGGTDTSRIIDEDVAGSFSFLGLAAYVPIFAQLSVPGQRGLADFEDTVAFSFPSLPDGVSFTSASVFFTGPAAVPSLIIGAELAGLVLACGCLLALARRRRRTA
jgi:uncharacterized membrane protein (GlpM family)